MRRIDEALLRLHRAAAIKLAYAALLLASTVLAAGLGASGSSEGAARGIEWPAQWDGRELRPLALGDVEQRFASRFPGSLARLSDGERQLVLRHVEQPTRMLHPAADCYRASGWRIESTRVETDAQQRQWRCFEALRQEGDQWRRVRVCERITDANGRAYTDTSGWFWAALLGRSTGPWLAVTTAQAL
jgi:hypothetical protein